MEEAFEPFEGTPIKTAKSIEDEQSMVFLPIQHAGDLKYSVKLGMFSKRDFFRVVDLLSLQALTPVVASVLSSASSLQLYKDILATRDVSDRIAKDAEKLFFYHYTARNAFHQITNSLNKLDSLLGFLPILYDSRQGTSFEKAIVDGKSHIADAKKMISGASGRGRSLAPLSEDVWFVKDVVRPALV
jgi:hypothetical protein